MKIFIANLPYHIKDTGLIQLFGLFGAVLSARIITQNGRSKGFGFLEMDTIQHAELAIKELDGVIIDDRHIIVRPADAQD